VQPKLSDDMVVVVKVKDVAVLVLDRTDDGDDEDDDSLLHASSEGKW
jgi:hypothetical protein